MSEALSIDAQEIYPETILDDLRADSIDVIELIMEFEDEFEFTVPDDNYERLRTIGDVVRYFERRQRGSQDHRQSRWLEEGP